MVCRAVNNIENVDYHHDDDGDSDNDDDKVIALKKFSLVEEALR